MACILIYIRTILDGLVFLQQNSKDMIYISSKDNFPTDRNGYDSFLCNHGISFALVALLQKKLSDPFRSVGKLS